MADSNAKTSIESFRKWVVDHKLRAVEKKRVFMAERYYGFDRLQLVSTRHENQCQAHSCQGLHAQALTLAALAGAAVVEYYDHKSGEKAERYAKFLQINPYSHKD
ncbi:unnamed protein product [Camellia sinensis]